MYFISTFSRGRMNLSSQVFLSARAPFGTQDNKAYIDRTFLLSSQRPPKIYISLIGIPKGLPKLHTQSLGEARHNIPMPYPIPSHLLAFTYSHFPVESDASASVCSNYAHAVDIFLFLAQHDFQFKCFLFWDSISPAEGERCGYMGVAGEKLFA